MGDLFLHSDTVDFHLPNFLDTKHVCLFAKLTLYLGTEEAHGTFERHQHNFISFVYVKI